MAAWSVPQIIKSGTAYIIGGGWSLRDKDLSQLPGLVIGVNVLPPGVVADFLLVGDCDLFLYYRDVCNLNQSKTVPVYMCPMAADYPHGFHLPRNTEKRCGISTDRVSLAWNGNTGGAAINLAYLLGATTINLLGFDMCNAPDGSARWHNFYGSIDPVKNSPKDHLNYPKMIEAFSEIAEDAKALGIEIINLSPDSDLSMFPKQSFNQKERLKNAKQI